jgi:phosphomannomutase/molybdopterin-guanine dinucleotide biosynthesis protein A
VISPQTEKRAQSVNRSASAPQLSAPDTPLRVVVLAGGDRAVTGDGQPLLTQHLGDRTVIEEVIAIAQQVAGSNQIYIVGPADGSVRDLIDHGYQYIVQREALGTGHAFGLALDTVRDGSGDVLILYGDTPLFRASSIRGLITRHRLKGAAVTLFTAIGDPSLPYGKIVRDDQRRIVDVVEDTDAGPDVRRKSELNLGAYAFNLDALSQSDIVPSLRATNARRLTDWVRQLARSGARIESYESHDPSEVRGINSPADLDHARTVLEARLFRPKRHEEENQIKFGTGGWRAIIGEGFTLHNVRRLCQALCNEVVRQNAERQGAMIGFDRRFLSRQAAEAAAEVFAGNNIRCMLQADDSPTPLIEYATRKRGAALGLAFTASHNPPEWNGLKVMHGDGSLLLEDETASIEDEANRLSTGDVIKLELDLALQAGVVQRTDSTNEYVDAVEALIDLNAIREARLKVIVDPMYGVGQLTLGTVLTEARSRVTFIHERHNPLFGGRSPAPNEDALRLLSSQMQEYDYDLGLAMDGDADRIAIVDEHGEYVSINDILLLVYWYTHEVRGERGGVVRNLSTTHLLDRLARAFGESCYETPVGFKHITAAMLEHQALLGGESSGGLTIRGHILGKDGIFAAALLVEMLAKTGERISALRERVYAVTGRLFFLEETLPATPEMRVAIPRRFRGALTDKLAGYAIRGVSHLDGTKLLLDNDNWALLRFSGTEPVLRLTVEADSAAKSRELVDSLRDLVTNIDVNRHRS